jgi:hypothetical protein
METTLVVLDSDRTALTYEFCAPLVSEDGELVVVRNDDQSITTTYPKDEWHSFFVVRHDT